MLFFYKPAFRKSPCAKYFIAVNISQFFTFVFAVFIGTLEYGYTIQTVNSFVWFCKIRYYLFYVFVANSRYNIVMDSIDRYTSASLAAPCFIIWRHDMTKEKNKPRQKQNARHESRCRWLFIETYEESNNDDTLCMSSLQRKVQKSVVRRYFKTFRKLTEIIAYAIPVWYRSAQNETKKMQRFKSIIESESLCINSGCGSTSNEVNTLLPYSYLQIICRGVKKVNTRLRE